EAGRRSSEGSIASGARDRLRPGRWRWILRATTQPARRPSAGAMAGRCGACLAVRTAPAAPFIQNHRCISVLLTVSMQAESTVEPPVVRAVHVAVAVQVEIPQVTGVTIARLERGPELITVHSVHVVVPIAVAELAEEGVHAVTTGSAVAVPVQLSPSAVVDVVREDRQGVAAVRQRPADELCPGEGEHGHRLAADQGDAELRVHPGAAAIRVSTHGVAAALFDPSRLPLPC